MKKLIVAVMFAFAAAVSANAECVWSWWVGAPEENVSKDVGGCVLGFASEVKSVNGAQVSLLWNKATKINGAQVSIAYNKAKTVRNGPQVGFVNSAESAALQFGLLCWNDGGFLPFFVFFNFDTTGFGARK